MHEFNQLSIVQFLLKKKEPIVFEISILMIGKQTKKIVTTKYRRKREVYSIME